MTKTALDLTEDERSAYHFAYPPGHRGKVTSREIATRKQQAWDAAKRAAELLRKGFGARRVVVFGSLVHERGFGAWSDIDLAAWGIPPELYYSAVGAVTGLFPSFKVDLVDIGDCRPTLRTVIEQEGIDI